MACVYNHGKECNAELIHLLRKIPQKSTPCGQRDIQSDLYYKSLKTCNQAGAIRNWQNTNIVTLTFCLSHTHARTHTNTLAQCTMCYFISRNHTNKKGQDDYILVTKYALRYTCSSK